MDTSQLFVRPRIPPPLLTPQVGMVGHSISRVLKYSGVRGERHEKHHESESSMEALVTESESAMEPNHLVGN